MGFLVKIICICCILSNSTSTTQWTVKIDPLNVTASHQVIIDCQVNYPVPKNTQTTIRAFWKALGKGLMNINSKDTNKFIFHPNTSFVMKGFQNKTKLIGDINKGNCSLLLINITLSGQYYLRVETGSEEYSFKKQPFTIVADNSHDGEYEETDVEPTPSPEETIVEPTPDPEESTSVIALISICVPVVLILLAATVTIVLVFIFKRRKRQGNLERQTSDYYVNFQTPRSSQPTSYKKNENIYKKKEPPQASKEEAIYTNVQGSPCVEASVGSDPKDNIYCNVGYDKQL